MTETGVYGLPPTPPKYIAFGIHDRGLVDQNATLTLTDDPPAPDDVAPDASQTRAATPWTWTQGQTIAPVTVPKLPDAYRRRPTRRYGALPVRDCLQHRYAGYQPSTHFFGHRNNYHSDHQSRRL